MWKHEGGLPVRSCWMAAFAVAVLCFALGAKSEQRCD